MFVEAKRRSRRRTVEEKTHPKRVDYGFNGMDFMCVMLAAVGQSTAYIAKQTGLTEGQVMYRIMKYEKERGTGEQTSRIAFRNGQGPFASAVIAYATRRTDIKNAVRMKLDERGLLNPPKKNY